MDMKSYVMGARNERAVIAEQARQFAALARFTPEERALLAESVAKVPAAAGELMRLTEREPIAAGHALGLLSFAQHLDGIRHDAGCPGCRIMEEIVLPEKPSDSE
jgi:hypothetical protein